MFDAILILMFSLYLYKVEAIQITTIFVLCYAVYAILMLYFWKKHFNKTDSKSKANYYLVRGYSTSLFFLVFYFNSIDERISKFSLYYCILLFFTITSGFILRKLWSRSKD